MKFNFLFDRIDVKKRSREFWLLSWRPFALLLLLGILLYSQTLFFDFVYFDDNSLIIDNAPILSQASLSDIFSNDVFFSKPAFYYRPLMSLSLWLDFHLFKDLSFWYHLVNLFLQVISAGLLFVFLQRLFQVRRVVAWWASVIFLIHPVLSSAVAWIPGRNDILLTIFVLASFIYLDSFLRRENWGSLIAHFIFFLAALFTKESAVFLPILALLYLFLIRAFSLSQIFRYRFNSGDSAPPVEKQEEGGDIDNDGQGRHFVILLAVWLVAIIVWFLPRGMVLDGSSFSLIDLLLSFINSFWAIFLYFGKIIFPINLSVFPTLADSPWWPGLSLLVLLGALFILRSRLPRRNFIIFGFAWFLLFIIPGLLSPDPSGPKVFLEHRLHLPLIGILIVLLELSFIKDLNLGKKSTRLGLSVLILVFIFLNLNNSYNYRNRLSFWSQAVLGAPRSAFAHSNLGAMYYLAGDLDLATVSYKKALSLNEREKMTHNNLGLVYLDEKKYAEAEKEFNLELAYNPNYDKTLFNMGRLYYLQKRYQEAAYYWQATLMVNPSHYQAYQSLILALNKVER